MPPSPSLPREHKTNVKRNFTEEFSLQISISQFKGGHKPRRQKPSDLHRLCSKSGVAFECCREIYLIRRIPCKAVKYSLSLEYSVFAVNLVQTRTHNYQEILTSSNILLTIWIAPPRMLNNANDGLGCWPLVRFCVRAHIWLITSEVGEHTCPSVNVMQPSPHK